MMQVQSANFAFLGSHAPQLVRLGALAEYHFRSDANASILKLRQFGEVMAQTVAANLGVYIGDDDRQIAVLGRLADHAGINRPIIDLFHQLRRSGNDAAHGLHDDPGTALTGLKIALRLAIWFHRSFAQDRDFTPPPFVPPPDPLRETEALRRELQALRASLAAADARRAEEAYRRQAAEEERGQWEALAAAVDAEKQDLLRRLADIQAQAETRPPDDIRDLARAANAAGAGIDLDEADTRRLIDGQLRQAGWDADSSRLTHANGVRPRQGRNLAIAEWPTGSGPADYVLFAGLQAVATVEAKRSRQDVSAAVDQAKRYSRDIRIDGDQALAAGAPWHDSAGTAFRVPFAFASNGRPYLDQVKTKSGVWFADLRRPTNQRRALESWYTPDGLTKALEQDIDASHARLRHEPFDYGLQLRPYQRQAIARIEQAIEQGRRHCLVAMATGTGKTACCIALVYRLLKTRRFHRILFLVDRSALGGQAADAFRTTRMENRQTFADIFDLKGLKTVAPDRETRVHIATVQGMVKRLLHADDDATIPPVDQYDCVVIDECHRGYLLDREMSDAEISFRDQSDYISTYRRVVDHFDAVRIGLTATPALHTVAIFGEPIFQYSYREAVIDGWLVDHEPPVRIVTALSEDDIVWHPGDDISYIDTATGEIDRVHLEDEVRMDIALFNRKVVTEAFNRVVCTELARHVDPGLPGKTLIFAANNDHADIVVNELKQALAAHYGAVDDDAVRKITAAVDRPQQLIRRYRNESLPTIAVTVDLLTTGIDVPAISTLVFLRRVNSRILYEQMLGRATRLCPEIGKQAFRIFDAVDLYAMMRTVTTMTPVTVNPSFTVADLVAELERVDDDTARDGIKDQIIAKLQRVRRHLPEATAAAIEQATGIPSPDLPQHLKSLSPTAIATLLGGETGLAALLDRRERGPTRVALSDHPDSLRRVEHGYGDTTRPEDYLESFRAFLETNSNDIPALLVVTQRPRDLTRADLKALRLKLETAGYPERHLQTAWRAMTNRDIAASIIGFIRQAALGDPLLPYRDRVDRAMTAMLASRSWTRPQRQWLERIGQQLGAETVIDRTAFDREPFAGHGGFNRLNRVFDGQLETIMAEINDSLWRDAG